jgi:hypothetical protein
MALGLGSRLNGCIQSYTGTTTKITNISTTNISTTTTTTTEKTLMAGGRSSSLGENAKLATSAKVNQNRTSRERKAKRLAEKMFFKLTRKGDRYSLCRTAGLSGPARRENLTLEQLEEELETWKLRGPHGG